MKMQSRIRLLTIVLSIVFIIIGCAQNIEGGLENTEENKAYLQEQLPLPVGYSYIDDIRVEKGNIYAALGQSRYNIDSVWKFESENNEWEKIIDLNKVLELLPTSFSMVVLADNGDIFTSFIKEINDILDVNTVQAQYCIIKQDGTVIELNIALPGILNMQENERVNSIVFSKFQEDKLFGLDQNGIVYLINTETGDIETTYTLHSDVGGFQELLLEDDKLIIASTRGVSTFDVYSGEEIGGETERIISEVVVNGAQLAGAIRGKVLLDAQEDSTYIVAENGLFKRDKNSNEITELMESSGTALYAASSYPDNLEVYNTEQFYVVSRDIETDEAILYRYTYGESIQTEELTIWSLNDGGDIHRAVSQYKSTYDHVKVNLEIAMSGEDGVTVTDAIANLNARLLAGEGPDVLYLDQVPIEEYVNNEMLYDLTNLLADIREDEPILSNIGESMKEQRGLYTIPSRFVLVGTTGTQEAIEATGSFSDIVEYAEHVFVTNNETMLFREYELSNVIQLMYYAEAEDWVIDGEIQDQKITQFVFNAKRLVELHGGKALNFRNIWTTPELSINYYEVGTGKSQLTYDYIVDIGYQQAGMIGVSEAMPNGGYQIPSSGFEGAFIPAVILGINSRSNNLSGAENFIRIQLSEQIQTTDTGAGFPINANSFAERLKFDFEGSVWEFEYEPDLTYYIRELENIDKDKILDISQKLDKPLVRNGLLSEIIFEQIRECVSGQISEEEAVEQLIQKITLYYAE